MGDNTNPTPAEIDAALAAAQAWVPPHFDPASGQWIAGPKPTVDPAKPGDKPGDKPAYSVKVETNQGANVTAGDTIGPITPSDQEKAVTHILQVGQGLPDSELAVKIIAGTQPITKAQQKLAQQLLAAAKADAEWVKELFNGNASVRAWYDAMSAASCCATSD